MRYPPRGRTEDLLSFLARAETRVKEGALPEKTLFGRGFVEPCCHILTAAASRFFEAIPADLDLFLQDGIYHLLGAGKPTIPFDPGSETLREAAALSRRAEELTRRRPAILCLESHPPIESDTLYLNLELMRHALKGLRQVRGRPCRPRMVVAVDAFGIDMLPSWREGGFAGFMSRVHLGFDRLPLERPWVGRFLRRGAVWPSIACRIARVLGAGQEVVMVLAGGMTPTARLYFCSREWAGGLCRRTRPAPAEFRRRLAQAAPGFAAFVRTAGDGPLGRSAWRLAEAWLLSLLCGTDAFPYAREGALSAPALDAARSIALAAGLGAAEAEAEVAGLRSEFAREVPYRDRFFDFVAGMTVRKGTPVLLLPLSWGDAKGVAFSFGPPAAVLSAAGSGEGRRVRVLDRAGAESERGARDFFRAFVKDRFA